MQLGNLQHDCIHQALHESRFAKLAFELGRILWALTRRKRCPVLLMRIISVHTKGSYHYPPRLLREENLKEAILCVARREIVR